MPITAGDMIAKIIGADPGQIVMQQNVSICQSIVLSCFDWSGRRNKLVTEELNFPSNLYIFHALERLGARLVTIPSPDGISVPLEPMLEAIDEQTLIVSVSHVIFRSGFVQDLKAIVDRAHQVGALVLADIYQSAGTIPINVKELGVDFATGGSVKWLCGGPGAAYLYVRPELWPKLEPRLTGWAAHSEPFNFEAGPIRYANNIARFLNGTPAIPALYAAQAGYEIIAEVGVQNIRAKSMAQTARLVELARAAGFKVNSPENPHERGGSVVIDILVDYRPGAGIRLGPHFYTKDEEIDLVIEEIKSILRTGAYLAESEAAPQRGQRL
jgi:kynureninase